MAGSSGPGTGNAPAAPSAPDPQSVAESGMLSSSLKTVSPTGGNQTTPTSSGLLVAKAADGLSGNGNGIGNTGQSTPSLPQKVKAREYDGYA